MKICISLLAVCVLLPLRTEAEMFGDLKDLARVEENVKSKRVSSYNREGYNHDWVTIPAGATKELFNVDGTGIITHIWITVDHSDPLSRRNLILRMYWDGETEPSVQAPLGDFFGQGWGEFYEYATPLLASGPSEGRSLVCYFPMPFSGNARITLENDSETDVRRFYYYVDYEEHDELEEDMGRFHAWYNRELTETTAEQRENEWALLGPDEPNTTGEGNYLFADIEGAGQFVGVNYYVNNPTTMWYGEGDDMFFIDGEEWPGSLHGTGTEDYFNTSWCPKTVYQHPWFGLARVNGETGWLGRTHCYRFHVQDPVRFTKSLRATIEHGSNNCLTLDISSVAYWYQKEPHKPFPPIGDRQARRPREEIGQMDIHIWRDAWREKMGGDTDLWGNEWQK